MNTAGITLKQLRYFMSAVERASITRAAKDWNVAQPALGAQIKLLEEALGVKLLQRVSHGMRPTESGEVFYAKCRKVEEAFSDAVRAVQTRQVDRIQIHIGLTNAMTLIFGERIFRLAKNFAPHLNIQIIEKSSAELDLLIRQKKIEMSISYSGDNLDDAVKLPMFRENLQYVGPTDRTIASPVGLAVALNEPVVLRKRGDTVRELVEGHASAIGREVKIAAEVESLNLTKKIVSQGPHGTILSASSVLEEVREGKLSMSPIVNPPIVRTIYLCLRSDLEHTMQRGQILSVIFSIAADTQSNNLHHLERLLPPRAMLSDVLGLPARDDNGK